MLSVFGAARRLLFLAVAGGLIDKILHLHGPLAYAVIFAVPAAEASIFVGFIFPGEIAVLFGGVLAFRGEITLPGAIIAAILGAVIGDSVGYEVGKHFGPRLLNGRLRRFIKEEHQDRASAFLRRNGGKAVFLGRFAAALRVLIPGLAGIAGIPYPTFLVYNLAGGAVWAGGFTLLGYFGGREYERLQHVIGRASLIVLGVVLFIVAVALTARWVASHRDRVASWYERVRARPPVSWIGRELDFLIARLTPGRVFGLELTLGAVAVGVIGLGFGLVLRDVASQQELVHIDRPILDFLIAHTEGGFSETMRVVTVFGSFALTAVIAALVAIVLAARKMWPRALLVLAAPLGASLIEYSVKQLVHRARPPVHALAAASGYGFPSGHAARAVALYGALAFVISPAVGWTRKVALWSAAVVIAALIGFSRMYLRVHYLTDVLGGFALGALWLSVAVSGAGMWRRARRYAMTRRAAADPQVSG